MVKKSFFSEYGLYAGVRGIGWVLQMLPPAWALQVGGGFGALAYWGQPKRRAICLGNLAAALSTERSTEELETICRGVFRTTGLSLVEVLRTPVVDEAYVDRHITIVGRERFEQALAGGRGVIFVTGHFGNWELIGLTAGLKGYPASVLARPQGLPRLNALLTRYRESKGCKVISKGMAVRAMVRQLKTAGIVGILADQDGGRRGVLAPFFGRLASTAPGPISLALRLGCPVMPVCIVRTGGLAHAMHLEPPLEFPRTGDEARDLQAGVAEYLRVLEGYVRRAPEQWLWPHRRWKSSPHQQVVVFHDGKAGHRAQALAVAGWLEQAWGERMARDPRLAERPGPWMRHQLVEVRFKAAWRRAMLMAAAVSGLTVLRPAWRWLRWALTPESARVLESTWGTFTVSCGAGAGVVSAVYSQSVAARAIHVMRPPWGLVRRFALRVVPQHDRWRESARTIVTRGAPHDIDPTALAASAVTWRERWALTRPVQIGLLIGGETRGVHLPPELVATVLDQLCDAAETLDAELVVTSSRRTSLAVERLLEDRLARHPRCRVLVLATRDRTPGIVPGILSVSTTIVTSGESVSMVSEAAAAGKPVFVFEPRCAWPWPKYRRLLSGLAREGHVRVVAPEAMGQGLVDAVRAGTPSPGLDDGAHVLARLREWL